MIKMTFAGARDIVVSGHPRFGDRPKSSIAILAIVVPPMGDAIGAVVNCYMFYAVCIYKSISLYMNTFMNCFCEFSVVDSDEAAAYLYA